MLGSPITSRRVWRRTDDFTPGTPKIKLINEDLPATLSATSVLIKVHIVALNYRDGNIAHGGNPWPVTPHGIPCNDAAGEVIAIGAQVQALKVGDRVAPNTDTMNITGRETERSWLAADEDGVLADHVIFDEKVLSKLPTHLPWEEASTIPCAGVRAWSALKGVGVGQTVLIQGKSVLSLAIMERH
nr:zinc-type alcohol dehydrogenase-like protein [Quercus suber]